VPCCQKYTAADCYRSAILLTGIICDFISVSVYTLNGIGKYAQCQSRVKDMLSANCDKENCGMLNVYQPKTFGKYLVSAIFKHSMKQRWSSRFSCVILCTIFAPDPQKISRKQSKIYSNSQSFYLSFYKALSFK